MDRRLDADVAMTDGPVVDVPGDEPARILTDDRPDVLAVESDVTDPLGRLREGDAYVEPWLHHVGLSFRGPGWEDTGHRASGAARGTGTSPRVLGDAAPKTLLGHNVDHRMKSRASRSSTATQEATQPRWRRSLPRTGIGPTTLAACAGSDHRLNLGARKTIVSRRSLRLAQRRRSCWPDVARRSHHTTRLCGTAR